MDKRFHFCFCVLLLIQYLFSGGNGVNAKHGHGHHHRHNNGTVKLFVFGDSYADTGNWKQSAVSWKEPYGITFPGKPSGRFSDGQVLTDYIATLLGVESPIPYTWRNTTSKSLLKSGMNFAFGGTGLFDTLVDAPNMTHQIDFFQQAVEEKVFTKNDLKSSVSLVSMAGNDYYAFVTKNSNAEDLPAFTKSLIDQLTANLKRIRSLGVRKVAVTALQPIGCLPKLASFSSYKNCSESWNNASEFHNQMLKKAVQKLNNDSRKHVFEILDLYQAFMPAFKNGNQAGNLEPESPLKPCCVGVTGEYSCGDIDKNGTKKYVVCDNPKLSVFWDMIHPSQNGWRGVYLNLQSSVHRLRLF